MAMTWKNLLRVIAPNLTSALDTPMSGIAMTTISTALLHRPDATEADLSVAMLSATTETLAELKKAEGDFSEAMKKLDVNLRDLTSRREKFKLSDLFTLEYIPVFIAAVSFVGFFAILASLIFYGVKADVKDVMLVMVGSLGTIVVMITAYFYGTSIGSVAKTKEASDIIRELLSMHKEKDRI